MNVFTLLLLDAGTAPGELFGERDCLSQLQPRYVFVDGQARRVDVPHVLEARQERVGSGLAEAAPAARLDGIGELHHLVQGILRAAPAADLVQHPQEHGGSHPAGSAPAAGFLHEELREVTHHLQHVAAPGRRP